MAEHGYNAYANGCRCDVCRAAKADYMREKRATARALRAADDAVPYLHHGISGYQDSHCRCHVCRAAKSAAVRRESRVVSR